MTRPPRALAPPITPGEVLREHVLARFRITQERLAEVIGVSRFSINQIVNGRRAVTAEMALRLARVTNTSPEFWLNLQRDKDLYEIRQKIYQALLTLDVLSLPVDDRDGLVSQDESAS